MPKSKRYAQWEHEHRKDVEMLVGIRERVARWEARVAERRAREAAHRAKLRRWTFGLLGREPVSDDSVTGAHVR